MGASFVPLGSGTMSDTSCERNAVEELAEEFLRRCRCGEVSDPDMGPRQKRTLACPAEERNLPWCFAWSPDKKLLAVGSADGSLAIWNIPKIRSQLAEIGLD